MVSIVGGVIVSAAARAVGAAGRNELRAPFQDRGQFQGMRVNPAAGVEGLSGVIPE
jgi:hypothetical protein